MQTSKISHLEMIYPPLSNKEAIAMSKDKVKHIEDKIKESDFYMICGKHRGYFKNPSINKDGSLCFDLMINNKIVDSGEIILQDLDFWNNYDDNLKIKVECGKDYIFILDTSKTEFNVIERFSPENILWFRSRNTKGILGLNNFKGLSVYDLLYVGIAKVGNSYDRLIKMGHKTRMEILATEKQRTDGVRITEETFLLFFRIVPLVISDDIPSTINLKQIVADAEKAFVSILKPKYNIIKFKKYPKGKDGLYKSNYNKYSYSISETLTLNTPFAKIKGEYSKLGITNKADYILVDRDNVELHLASE